MEIVDNKAQKSKKDAFLTSYRERHPELDMSDEEALYGAIDSDFRDSDDRWKRQQEVDKALSEHLTGNPKFASFFMNTISGEDAFMALLKEYGDDILAYLDDPDKAEELAEMQSKRLEKLAQSQELEDTYNKNLEQSLIVADEVQQQGGYSDEQMNEAFTLIFDDANRAIMGEITADMLHIKLKGLNYDVDMSEAERTGEVRGKNAKIEEKLRGIHDDSLMPPMLEGKNGGQARRSKETDALDKLVKKQDIWADMKRGR